MRDSRYRLLAMSLVVLWVSACSRTAIHKNYNSWVNNLIRDINLRLVPPAV